jgi:hypothetical protein
MDSVVRYSAAMPAAPFVFSETKIVAKMMLDSYDRNQIRQAVHDGNLFQVKTESNEQKIFNYAYNRMNVISDPLKRIIVYGDETDGRFVNFISIMKYDDLFREFVVDVYFERLTNRNPITDYDIMSFFERKGREDQNVASWKYVTVFKLRRLYTRVLFESGLLKTSSGNRVVCTPYISRSTVEILLKEGYENYIDATLGHK